MEKNMKYLNTVLRNLPGTRMQRWNRESLQTSNTQLHNWFDIHYLVAWQCLSYTYHWLGMALDAGDNKLHVSRESFYFLRSWENSYLN